MPPITDSSKQSLFSPQNTTTDMSMMLLPLAFQPVRSLYKIASKVFPRSSPAPLTKYQSAIACTPLLVRLPGGCGLQSLDCSVCISPETSMPDRLRSHLPTPTPGGMLAP